MTITVTFRELIDKGWFDKVCKIKGYNPWIINEGLASMTDTVELTSDEFKLLDGDQ